MPSLLLLRCSLALGAWGWLRKTPDQDYIFQIACSEKVPILQLYGRYVRAIRCKWIFKSFTLWSSSPPISLSILSTQVQVEVLPFILTLEYTELLWFLLSLFPSVLFIFFCRKSSVSYLSLFSLFLSQAQRFLFSISMYSWQLTSYVPERGSVQMGDALCACL